MGVFVLNCFLQVISTSRKIFDLLHQQTCLGNHEHQVIEGSPVVHGCRVNRSQYTEDYPQEFACQVARVLIKPEVSDRSLGQREAIPRKEQALTLQEQPSKKASSDPSLVLQTIASMTWTVKSFGVKAAFLQGSVAGRTIGIEPVPKLSQAMGLAPNEVCKLNKGEY